MAKNELRTISGANLRAEQSASTGKRVVRGRAASYSVHTVIGAGSRGAFREVILPGAFTAAVARGDDARLTLNHSSDLVYGRVGRNLTLREAKDGLYFECSLLDSTAANDFYANVKAQIFDQCSFAFRVERENWTEGSDSPCSCCGENSKLPLRELASVQLFDVAVVDRPQYVGTSAAAGTVVEDLSQNNADDDDDPEGTDWLEQSSVRVSVEARRHAAQLVEQRTRACKKPRFTSDEERKAHLTKITAELRADQLRRLEHAERSIRLSDIVSDLGLESQAARDAAAEEDARFEQAVRITKRNARWLAHPSESGLNASDYLDWLRQFLAS